MRKGVAKLAFGAFVAVTLAAAVIISLFAGTWVLQLASGQSVARAQTTGAHGRSTPDTDPAPGSATEPSATPIGVGTEVPAGPTDVARVALTFDDGPSVNTTTVIDTLNEYGVTATFFFVGARVDAHRDAVRYAVRSGLELGNHTYHHTALTRPKTDAEMDEEITRSDEAIADATGVTPFYVRPYGGVIDDAGYDAVKRTGHQVALWTCPCCDANTNGTKAEEIARIELGLVKPGDVMLMHETNPESVKALPIILAELQRRGWKVESVGELLSGH